ncbi:PAS domain S-box protein, partial [Treponema pallidum]
MRDFIARALKKSAKMNDSQLRNMIELIANEYTLLDALMDSLNYGLIVLDCLHIPLKTNRAIARLLGKPLPSNPRRPLWHYLDDEHIAQFIVAIIKNEVGKARAEFIVQRQGETLYLEVSLFPLICDQKIRGSIIAIHDITEKKQEEIYNRRLESLANLTNLAATVAHEIKNPLGAMSIHLQL